MATKKVQKEEETLPAWNGQSGHEVKCHKCNGMVNHNGCAEKGCPVAQANERANSRHA
jgi:hypothetical protein